VHDERFISSSPIRHSVPKQIQIASWVYFRTRPDWL